ncbi:membrane or secreted protein [Candidatus Magnetobacterium bavaricum]|uniref:Membrane or secreted protein n=1 Tax=Candidatus Magnetobacterium bavaricum TaxID=29290 RepID=A0A0F3GL46_9BACT|nr:membrane or secreted protein [Candidatus Magnetobacterium bavaricum]
MIRLLSSFLPTQTISLVCSTSSALLYFTVPTLISLAYACCFWSFVSMLRNTIVSCYLR